MEAPPESGDGRRCLQQSLGGKGAEGTYEIGLDRRNLTLQKGETGFNLIGFGIPVARRAAFDDIANVNLAAGQFDGFDNTGQKLTGGTDKRFSLPVLFKSGALADKYKLGPGITFTKYNTVSFPGQAATLTIT
jgi:hypothetical protein